MIEFAKVVLRGVSIDRYLFSKELGKIIRWFEYKDIEELKIWCLITFGHLHEDIILEQFNYPTRMAS
ncbi:MAG: hypothetical protein KKA07_11300 [Bacteroidetes bacterium]|nr:hypothetical protein [Bacteroidota bacterium]MBU1719645.1 hypothetical protein [Bacteroidota bacterium]